LRVCAIKAAASPPKKIFQPGVFRIFAYESTTGWAIGFRTISHRGVLPQSGWVGISHLFRTRISTASRAFFGSFIVWWLELGPKLRTSRMLNEGCGHLWHQSSNCCAGEGLCGCFGGGVSSANENFSLFCFGIGDVLVFLGWQGTTVDH